MQNTTMEGNLPFWDLLAAEKHLVVFIENIFRRPGLREWWLTFFPSRNTVRGTCDRLIIAG